MRLQQKESMFDLRGYSLVAIGIAWLAGILLNSMLLLPALVLCIGVCLFGLLIIVFYQDRQTRFVLLLALCACLGAWRYSIALPSNDPHSITTFIGPTSLEVRGTVADEPQVEVRTRLMLVDASTVSTDGGSSWKEAHGEIEVRTLDTVIEDPYGANYGDSVELQGKLQPPPQLQSMCAENAVDTNTGYTGVFASMLFPRVSVQDTGTGSDNPVIAFLYRLRATLATVIEQALPQPAAALLVAVVLGLQTLDLHPLKSAFSLTGTIHLTVSSGFKVTILAGLVASSTRIFYKGREAHLLLPAQKLRDWRPWLATGFVIVSIAAYTVLSGFGPAAIRAGIMGILMAIAPRLGRVYNVYAALAFAALVMGNEIQLTADCTLFRILDCALFSKLWLGCQKIHTVRASFHIEAHS